jgi:hypothetical protein
VAREAPAEERSRPHRANGALTTPHERGQPSGVDAQTKLGDERGNVGVAILAEKLIAETCVCHSIDREHDRHSHFLNSERDIARSGDLSSTSLWSRGGDHGPNTRNRTSADLTVPSPHAKSESMKLTLTLVLVLATACGSSSKSGVNPSPSKAATDEHRDLSPEINKFHDALSPRWHAEKGPQRMKDTCTAVDEFQVDADALTKSPPAGSDVVAWTTSTKELSDAVTALGGTCKANDAASFESAFERVHRGFHVVMEAGGGPKESGVGAGRHKMDGDNKL